MTTKSDQRRRRKAGFEVVSPTVIKHQLVAWLIWEEVLTPDDLIGTPGEVRDRITRALETYLAQRYSLLADNPDEPNPAYATDHPWQELEALRDRPPATALMTFGVLELDRARWVRRPNPTPYLITAKKAAIRKAADNIPEPDDYLDMNTPGEVVEHDGTASIWLAGDRSDPHYVANDYDPEENIEEASADLSDEAIEQVNKAEDDED